MDVNTVLPGDHISAHNAAVWLREHLNIDMNRTVVEEFEQHFNCRVEIQDRLDSWMQPDRVIFNSAAERTAFLLKWS